MRLLLLVDGCPVLIELFIVLLGLLELMIGFVFAPLDTHDSLLALLCGIILLLGSRNGVNLADPAVSNDVVDDRVKSDLLMLRWEDLGQLGWQLLWRL